MDAGTQIRAARVRSIYERLAMTSLITVANAALMTAVLVRSGDAHGPWAWLAMVAALAAIRTASWRVYRGDPRVEQHLDFWEAASVIASFLSGALWGLGAVLLFPADETGQWLWIFLIAGMCAGAASLHAAHLPTAIGFIVPAGLPLALRLITDRSQARQVAAVMTVIFVLSICVTAMRFGRQFGQVLRLQHDLQRRSQELDETNRRLVAEIKQHRSTADTLHQAQKMEALGHITGGIAHDFNNLLTVITGSMDLIRRHAVGDEAIQRLAAAASHAARRGARLTGSLLSFARKQSLHPEVVDLNALIVEFSPLLRRAVGEAIDLQLDLAPDLSAAYADAAHFQSALLNLVINARDAMPGGGPLVVSTCNAELGGSDLVLDSETHRGRAVQVSVRDSGLGMAPEVVERAFEPFFTTKQVGKGSGLGLAQVYGFTRQSGGFATIESAPGEGSQVSMTLPALASGVRPQARAARPALAGSGQPLHVLLAEDDGAVAAILSEALSLLGWEVVAAPTGQDALTVLDQRPDIEVLVTDVVMAGVISGLELARLAAQRRPGLPVLLISGYSGESLSDNGLIEGEFDLLQKPFSHQDLALRIQAAVGRGSREAPGPREVSG